MCFTPTGFRYKQTVTQLQYLTKSTANISFCIFLLRIIEN